MQPVDPAALEAAIEQTQPTRKMSVVRALMPKINDAVRRGLSKKEIWESLHGAGLDMSYKLFACYVARSAAPGSAHEPMPPANNEFFPDALPGRDSSQSALEQARKNVAVKDYSKLMRNRKTGKEQ